MNKGSSGFKVEVKSPIGAMQRAAYNNNVSKLEELLTSGADVNTSNDCRQTSLHFAAIKNIGDSHFGTIEVLLKHGANVNAKDHFKTTPLYYLVKRANVKTIKLLLSYGANVNIKETKRKTPLFRAVSRGDSEIIQLLVDNGADVNVQTQNRKNALHKAWCLGNLDIIKILLRAGAKIIPGFLFLDNKWKITLEHVAKLQASDLPVDFMILETISGNEKFDKYLQKCTQELLLAKSTKLKNCWVTFLDLLKDSGRKLKNYAGNEDLVDDFRNSDCLKKFPIYGKQMQEKMEEGLKRRDLFDNASITLSDCLPIFNPNHLIIRDVLDKVSMDDLSKLCA